MILSEKPDGRKYSRVLRRSITLIDHMADKNLKFFSLRDIAKDINENKKFIEFYILRTEKQMSISRIQDYLRYLVILKTVEKIENDKYRLSYKRPKKDEEWVQSFSDMALEHLCEILSMDHEGVINAIKTAINDHLDKKQIPTIDALVKTLDIDSGRSEELFRWSLYVFLDSPICPFYLRRNPFLTIKD